MLPCKNFLALKAITCHQPFKFTPVRFSFLNLNKWDATVLHSELETRPSRTPQNDNQAPAGLGSHRPVPSRDAANTAARDGGGLTVCRTKRTPRVHRCSWLLIGGGADRRDRQRREKAMTCENPDKPRVPTWWKPKLDFCLKWGARWFAEHEAEVVERVLSEFFGKIVSQSRFWGPCQPGPFVKIQIPKPPPQT